MGSDNLLDRIRFNPKVFGGKPIIRGLRISVEMILDLLSQGVSIQEILEDYPELEFDDIRACLAYARAVIANEEIESLQLEMA
ncbi:MAG: DUF433 domain-containing protein [candidate division KSB1 bacterium]|nr:DUF433 domain-containing protein [candidate division KSB1 bacterium]